MILRRAHGPWLHMQSAQFCLRRSRTRDLCLSWKLSRSQTSSQVSHIHPRSAFPLSATSDDESGDETELDDNKGSDDSWEDEDHCDPETEHNTGRNALMPADLPERDVGLTLTFSFRNVLSLSWSLTDDSDVHLGGLRILRLTMLVYRLCNQPASTERHQSSIKTLQVGAVKLNETQIGEMEEGFIDLAERSWANRWVIEGWLGGGAITRL